MVNLISPTCSSWNNIPINQSDLRDSFTTRPRGFYTILIHPVWFRFRGW